MADAVLYSSLDPSGPGDVSATGPGITQLYNLLVPCLVTGYGSGASAKPGQGWTLIHANLPVGFKLRAPDGVYYTFYRGSASNTTASGTSSSAPCAFQVFMSEGMGDITVYPPVGTNVRSMHYSADNNSSYANRHWMSVGGSNYSDSTYKSKVWTVVARGSQVLIIYTSLNVEDPSSSTISDAPSSRGGCLLLGNAVLKDPSAPKSGPQNSMILGGYNLNAETWTGSSYSTIGGTPFANFYTRLRDPISGLVETGSLATCTGYAARYMGDTAVATRLAADPVPADLTPLRVPLWHGSYGEIGFVPGIFICPRAWIYRPDQMYTLLGMGATYQSMLLPVTISGEPFYFLPTAWGTLAVSLLEKYWQ